jgi:hypothetical protein
MVGIFRAGSTGSRRGAVTVSIRSCGAGTSIDQLNLAPRVPQRNFPPTEEKTDVVLAA